jgi:(S)-ureidoglycine aminohydrolase
MAYPVGLLKTRAVIRPGEYAVIPPEGRVRNVIPGIERCAMSIIASPKLGASFVQYVGTAFPDGGTSLPFASEPGIESFLYVLDGEGTLAVSVGEKTADLAPGGYVYAQAGQGLSFRNTTRKPVRVLLYKQRYAPLAGHAAEIVFGDASAMPERIYEDMANVFIRDLLPIHLGFDMNMHILSFEPAGCHPFVETHVQEHGAYLLEGEGLYLLGHEWIQVQKEDFIFFGPFTPQAVYATGRGRLTYIYSKDCNRDVAL